MNKGDKVRVVQLVCTVIAFLVSIAALIYFIFFVATSDNINIVLARETSPASAPYLVLIPVLLEMIVAWIGFIGALRKNRQTILAFFWAQIITLVFIMAAFIYVLLMGNGTFSGGTLYLTDKQSSRLAIFAISHPDEWAEFQNSDSGSCCGLSVRFAYNSSEGGFSGLPNFDLEDIYSGDYCIGSGIEQVEEFKAKWPIYNATVLNASKYEDPYDRERFICTDTVVDAMRDPALPGGLLVGCVFLFSTFAVASAAMLLYSIKQTHGGLKPEALYPIDDLALLEDKKPFCWRLCPGRVDDRSKNTRAVIKFEGEY